MKSAPDGDGDVAHDLAEQRPRVVVDCLPAEVGGVINGLEGAHGPSPPPGGEREDGERDQREPQHGTTLKDHDVKVPNQDGAGTIEAVGEGVDLARVGERRWRYFAAWKRQYGTAAELCTLPAEPAAPLPDVAPADLGASLGIPALSAHRLLLEGGPLEARTAAVAGGAGAVGHAAVETGAVGKVLVDVSPAA